MRVQPVGSDFWIQPANARLREFEIGSDGVVHGVARGKSAMRVYELLEWQGRKDQNSGLAGNNANCKTALDYVLGRTKRLVSHTEDEFKISGTAALASNLFDQFKPPFEVQIPGADKETVGHFVFLVGRTRGNTGIVFDKDGHEDTPEPTRFRLLDLEKIASRHIFVGDDLDEMLWRSY